MAKKIDMKFRKPVRILVVDDDSYYRTKVRTRLQAKGYVIDEAELPEDAMEQLSNARYHIVLVDQMMKDSEGRDLEEAGYDLGKHIKDKYSYNYVIIVTSREEFDPIKRAISDGVVDDYVEKKRVLKEKDFFESKIIQSLEKRKTDLKAWGDIVVYKAEPLDFLGQECKVINKITESDFGAVELFDESWYGRLWEPWRLRKKEIEKDEICIVKDLDYSSLYVTAKGTRP